MPNNTDIVDSYIASWNEADDAKRRELVAQTFATGARYVDPLVSSAGHAGIAAMIQAVQGQFPGLVFARTGKADQHGRYLRFSWTLGPAGGTAVAGGTDFAIVDLEGRLDSVTGFLDFVPAG
jgi:hypothetical protein